ncbi:peptidoglycan recognition family protein [Kitasatospora sp. NPDC087315]|uniref:peptidoglycan recognition protein family protein n=1 Tax=Kitasatospora sp. NPDC087315 TaxID=3364069 RepID=UPI00381D1EF9
MTHAQPALPRRTVLGAIGAGAVALAVTPAVSAAAPAPAAGTPGAAGGGLAGGVPQTRAISPAGTAATRVRAGFPIRYAAVSWQGPRRGASIRFHRAGEAGPWQPLPAGCAGGPDGHESAGAGALVAAGGADGYDLHLPDGASRVRSAAIDTAHGPVRAQARAVAGPLSFCGVEYLSRAAWGADESKRFKDGVENSPVKYYPLQTLTVHHTDTVNADPDPAASVRAVYEYHAVTLDWGDIGYHFLIDEAGRVYEGRWSGDDGIPAHDAAGNVVTAFHTSGFNSGNLGIALLGTLSGQAPTGAARRSLTVLLGALTRAHGLDPRAHTTFVNPVNGVTRPVDMISGHRDWLATDCPGGVMYASLPQLRADVAALGRAVRGG